MVEIGGGRSVIRAGTPEGTGSEVGMKGRFRDLVGKAWSYLIEGLGHPGKLPRIVRHGLLGGAHLGSLLQLLRYERWLAGSGIETVVDIGAHRGEFSSAVRVILPQARILAFEPLPDAFEALAVRFAGDPKLRAFNVALGDSAGEIVFHRSRFSKASSVLEMDRLHRETFPWSSDSEELKVRVAPLDQLLADEDLRSRVLLKIDVQGYEARVLAGASATLGDVDYVLVETSYRPLYRGQASFADVYATLESAGFVFAGNLDQLVSPVDQSILQADALFERP